MKVDIISSLNSGVFTGSFPKWMLDKFEEVVEEFINTRFDKSYREVNLHFPIQIGQGPARRTSSYELPFPERLLEEQMDRPVCLVSENGFVQIDGRYNSLFLFRNRLFKAETAFVSTESSEEAELLVRRAILSADARISKLRQEVMALEIAITGSERKRTAIPSYVRLAVYNRDNGECTYCHSRENLHFDHILPVAKGGSNDEKNIQLLCETCNWTKSDRIDG